MRITIVKAEQKPKWVRDKQVRPILTLTAQTASTEKSANSVIVSDVGPTRKQNLRGWVPCYNTRGAVMAVIEHHE